jgi:hypothetical protein
LTTTFALQFWFEASLGLFLGIFFCSFFEWALHRFVMHRPVGKFRYPYEAHALTHHRIFRADETYHLHEEKHKWTIPMAWWNGPVLIAIGMTPFLIASVITQSWGIVAGALLAATLYYGAYEYMHWCMHLPKNRHVEQSWIFYRLNGHHLLHHQ